MNIVLLSGGSGKRLWPLSNDIRSKQFIKIFKDDNGEYESMVQRIYGQIQSVDLNSNITIATSKSQVSSIYNQLGENVGISVEPCRRDTFPAIALASLYLKDVKNVDLNDVVIVCPVDPYVEKDYFKKLKELENYVKKQDVSLALLGMNPTYPSEKYGYILPESDKEFCKVLSFEEKPEKEKAIEYINQNALWNGGVFAYKLKYVIEKAHELYDFKDYYDLYQKYETLDKISFDRAVCEKEKDAYVLRFDGKWKDLGTWNTLSEEMDENTIGNVILNDNCKNINVINELDVPILCMGLSNIIVSASPEGILVSDKEQSSYIKPYVNDLSDNVRFAEKSWGNFKVIDVEEESLTIKVTLNKGNKMHYHSHEKRDEVWIVISGIGEVIIDGEIKEVKTGDVIEMEALKKHSIFAKTDLKLIEIQLGKDINVKDKIKYD